MNLKEFQLPSNKRFGFFFAFVFAVTTAYFFISSKMTPAYVFTVASLTFLIITLIRDELLLPLNKLWMRLGLFLGMIFSPIILGIIFFGIFTPLAILMRLFGRDELKLKSNEKNSYWIVTNSNNNVKKSFKQQF